MVASMKVSMVSGQPWRPCSASEPARWNENACRSRRSPCCRRQRYRQPGSLPSEASWLAPQFPETWSQASSTRFGGAVTQVTGTACRERRAVLVSTVRSIDFRDEGDLFRAYDMAVSGYTDISVLASAIENQRCCSFRNARQLVSTRLNCSLFAASSSRTCSSALWSAFKISWLRETSTAPAATRRVSALGLRES